MLPPYVILQTFRYKKYVMLDPRGVVTKTRSSDDEDLTGPAEAPMTIAMGESVGQKEKETFIYRPDLGEVPLISVPDSLPDLMGESLVALFSLIDYVTVIV